MWPFGAALRGEASNRLMPRWLKTVVVSEVEKAPDEASGRDREGVASQPVKCRKGLVDIETRASDRLWDESGGYPLTGQAVSGI